MERPGIAFALALALAGCSLGYAAALDEARRGAVAPIGDAGGGAPEAGAGAVEAGDGAAGETYAEAVRADAPIYYWPLDDSAGDRVRSAIGGPDLVVSGNVRFLEPGALQTGAAAGLDGASSFRLASSALRVGGNRPFSFECWYRLAAVTNDRYGRIVTQRPEVPKSGYYVVIDYELLTVSFQVWNAGFVVDELKTGLGIADRFRHLVFTTDGTSRRFYLDGNLAVSQPVGGAIPEVATPLSWGDFYTGELDELAAYDKALSADRIRAHHEASRR